jgi:peroxiredoxin
MKNIHNFNRFLIFLSIFFLTLSAISQTTPKGYEIVYKPLGKIAPYLYLTGIYGDRIWIADSAKFAKNQYVFKNNKQVLPSGFYAIQSLNDDNQIIHAEFIVDKTRKFTIEDTRSGLVFTNSEENVVFRKLKEVLLTGNDLRIFYETAPESLLGKFVLAQYIPVSIPEFFWGSHAGQEAAAQKYYQYLINHYYDNVDFKDIRLMYTPLDIDLKDFFMESLYPQPADNVINSIENLFNRILDKKPTQPQLDTRDFYLKKLIHLYMTADPKFDTVFVYLTDNYVSKLNVSEFISDSEKNVFKRIADRKRRTLVGHTVPVFESFTIDAQKVSTADITSKYMVLWFWDPDCEHCVEYTPKMKEFYTKYHELYNFEVIACSVTEDYDRWKKFIVDYHLEWYNTSYAIEEPNYDAVEYFNFNDTPAIFIIDKQHRIVARQFPLDELFEVFESLQN